MNKGFFNPTQICPALTNDHVYFSIKDAILEVKKPDMSAREKKIR
jgi:hypothetical protein